MRYIQTILFFFVISTTLAQSDNINYSDIYKYALDAKVYKADSIIKTYDSDKLNSEGLKFIKKFKARFSYPNDRSDYLKIHTSKMDSLLMIYRDYWRKSLLDTVNYDTLLVKNVYSFLKKKYPLVQENKDTLNTYLKHYITSLGYHTTGFGKTGKLYDILVWKTEKDTLYYIKNKALNINASVVFMEDFVSSGWAEYATLGKYYASGWATENKLFCVKHKYDINSEKFLVSFLAHEAQHFKDYTLFNNLSSPELEYRAKLVELSSARKTIYQLIDFFATNSNKGSENGHSKANYYVIRHLSQHFFHCNFEKDADKWISISRRKINKAALKLLSKNTDFLKQKVNNIQDKCLEK